MNRREDHIWAAENTPLLPHGYWSWDRELVSRREGWILSNDSDDCVTISRIDDPASVDECPYDDCVFEGDMEAQEWVIEMALKGSVTHLLALFLMGNPVECRLNMDVPLIFMDEEVLERKREQTERINHEQ